MQTWMRNAQLSGRKEEDGESALWLQQQERVMASARNLGMMQLVVSTCFEVKSLENQPPHFLHSLKHPSLLSLGSLVMTPCGICFQ